MVIDMFTSYKIIDNVLYLNVNDKCEIGSFFSDDKYKLIDKIKKYIKDKKMNFNGTKAVLIISGLMLGSVYLNNIKAGEPVKENYKYVYGIVDKSVPNIVSNTQSEEPVNEDKSDISNFNEEKTTTKTNDNSTQKVNTAKSAKKSNISSAENTNTSNTNTSNTNTNNTNTTQKELKQAEDKMITLKRSNGQTINMSLDEYLIGVVAAEMPASFNIEALKAQAVVARTYTLKLIEQKRELTDTVSTQVYKSNEELKNTWQSSYNKYYSKVRSAVMDTKDLCIKYNGKLIDAVYHASSNGYTQDAKMVWNNDIPYLKSVPSPWDTTSSAFLRSTLIPFSQISSTLGTDFNPESIIEVLLKDDSGRISKIKINDKEYTGVQIRNLLGLRSADFDYEIKDDGVNFTTRGYGHGVGMSQYGANGMANSGYNYRQIINYYYTNVNIEKI